MRVRLIEALVALCSLASTGASVAASAGSVGSAPIAATDAGRVQGSIANGVKSWKGIPFAAPPVGARRWRPPQPAAAWRGVRDATHYGHDCMQLPFPSDAAPLGTEPSEDCLVLNVWAPERTVEHGKLPVVAWIYGGGFVNGGSSPPTYSGENMARKGIVFVSFNYRLGRFGTFLHPQLAAENISGAPPGNYVFMDQLAALQWIRRNVAAFGGDPANVTLIGESAGGMSVNTMLTSPMAQGLFQRAIILSGGDGRTAGAAGRAAVERESLAFAASKGIAPDDPEALRKLRALPPEAVVDQLNLSSLINRDSTLRNYAGPFVDGQLALDPASVFAGGRFAHVPVMIGATSNDAGGPTGYMVAGAHALAAAISAAGVPTFEYRFSYVASAIGKPGAEHASDIPFFFDTEAVKYGDKSSARDLAMGRTISAYLVNFARTGDPSGAGLPKWPRYTPAEGAIMDFAEDGRAVAVKGPIGSAVEAAPPAAH